MFDLSLAALVDAFRRKVLTPLDYLDALEKAWQPHINAEAADTVIRGLRRTAKLIIVRPVTRLS